MHNIFSNKHRSVYLFQTALKCCMYSRWCLSILPHSWLTSRLTPCSTIYIYSVHMQLYTTLILALFCWLTRAYFPSLFPARRWVTICLCCQATPTIIITCSCGVYSRVVFISLKRGICGIYWRAVFIRGNTVYVACVEPLVSEIRQILLSEPPYLCKLRNQVFIRGNAVYIIVCCMCRTSLIRTLWNRTNFAVRNTPFVQPLKSGVYYGIHCTCRASLIHL